MWPLNALTYTGYLEQWNVLVGANLYRIWSFLSVNKAVHIYDDKTNFLYIVWYCTDFLGNYFPTLKKKIIRIRR